MGKIAKGVDKINFTMLYGNYCYIMIENFPQKFSLCGKIQQHCIFMFLCLFTGIFMPVTVEKSLRSGGGYSQQPLGKNSLSPPPLPPTLLHLLLFASPTSLRVKAERRCINSNINTPFIFLIIPLAFSQSAAYISPPHIENTTFLSFVKHLHI